MRATKRVLIGSLAAASDRASFAVCTVTPSISKITRPGFTRATHNSGVPLPEPMRTSAGFLDTGTSGKMRIQTRPARFMCRVSARRAAFAIPLHPRDFGAAETARAVDTNAFGAEPHRRLHRALHGAAERDTTLELLRDRFGNQRGVQFGLADLDDVDDDVRSGDVGNPLAQLVDVSALLSDHDAGTSRMDRHPALLVRTLDHDPGHRRLLQLLVEDLADFDILVQQLAVFVLAGEPTGIPRPVNAETQPDWIDLLTHRSLPRPVKRSPRPDERRSSAARMV